MFLAFRVKTLKLSKGKPQSKESKTHGRRERRRNAKRARSNERDVVDCLGEQEKDSPGRGENIPNRTERHERTHGEKTLKKSISRSTIDVVVPGRYSKDGHAVRRPGR